MRTALTYPSGRPLLPSEDGPGFLIASWTFSGQGLRPQGTRSRLNRFVLGLFGQRSVAAGQALATGRIPGDSPENPFSNRN
jgi:hypothetical protein